MYHDGTNHLPEPLRQTEPQADNILAVSIFHLHDETGIESVQIMQNRNFRAITDYQSIRKTWAEQLLTFEAFFVSYHIKHLYYITLADKILPSSPKKLPNRFHENNTSYTSARTMFRYIYQAE